MADAKGYKLSPKITTDSTLNDLVMDPGVPWDTAAGSRDPDPHPKEQPPLPAPAPAVKAPSSTSTQAPATTPKVAEKPLLCLMGL